MDFLNACGAAGPLTFEIEGPGLATPRRWVSHEPYVLIGRDDRADLILDDEAVSRRHAYLQLIQGRVFVIDLDSRTGTLTAGGNAEAGWLSPGQAITVGPYTVRLTPSNLGATPDQSFDPTTGEPVDPPSPLHSKSAKNARLSKVSLEFQSRSAGLSVWRMSQLLALVGTSTRCRVRLIESSISKLHCALVRTPQGLWAIDLLGRGGITVNGVAVRAGRLRPADVLGVGHMTIRASFEGGLSQDDGPVPITKPSFEFGNRPTPPGAALPERQSAPAWGNGLPPLSFPSNPGLPAISNELGSQEPALSLLLNHFGQMQQQMMDQFQQSMLMMLQMFSGMHKDQMGLVREELDRLRELNNEIAAIKAEMKQRPATPAPAPAAPRAANGHADPAWPAPPKPPTAKPRPSPAAAATRPATRVRASPGAAARATETSTTGSARQLNAINTEQQNRWRRSWCSHEQG
ncbi:MAG: FHA domain-containing protein [Isosphaeraceae bacterium]